MDAIHRRRLRIAASHLAQPLRCPTPSPAATATPAPPAGLSVDLSGRLALVTGATGQLGRTMVKVLATAGADVAVHYRGNREKAESLSVSAPQPCPPGLPLPKHATRTYRDPAATLSSSLPLPLPLAPYSAPPQLPLTPTVLGSCRDVEALGRRACAVHAAVDDEASVQGMKEAIEAAMGEAPDIVVANAVQQYDWTSVLEQGVEDYESQFR